MCCDLEWIWNELGSSMMFYGTYIYIYTHTIFWHIILVVWLLTLEKVWSHSYFVVIKTLPSCSTWVFQRFTIWSWIFFWLSLVLYTQNDTSFISNSNPTLFPSYTIHHFLILFLFPQSLCDAVSYNIWCIKIYISFL